MEFYLVDPEEIEKWWPLVEHHIQRVLDEPCGPDLYDLQSIYYMAKGGSIRCLIAEDVSFAMMFSIQAHPLANILDCFICAGKDPCWEDLDAALNNLCKIFNCKYRVIDGRKGWERLLKPLGWTFGGTSVYKEVN